MGVKIITEIILLCMSPVKLLPPSLKPVCFCLRLPAQRRRTALQDIDSTRTRNTSPAPRQLRASLISTPPPTLLRLLLPVLQVSLAAPPWPSLTPPTAQTWGSARRACLRAPSPDWTNSAARPGRTTARCPPP